VKIMIPSMFAALVPALLVSVAALAQAPSTSSSPAPSGPEGSMTLDQYMARALPRMMAADTDGDGRIAKAEAQAMGRGGGDRMFDMADTNHDGYLDKAEIQAALTQRFQRMDSNGDGIVTPDERAAQRGMRGGPRGHRGGDAMQPASPPAPGTPQ
jgi:hypothetical protein